MRRAFTQLHLAILLAGFTGILGKLISVNEGLLTWYRLLFSGIILLLYLLLSRKLRWFGLRDILLIAGAGFLLALHWLFFYGSIKFSNVSVGVVCFSLTGFFTSIFEPLINRKPFSTQEILLSGITLCGIALIFGLDTSYRTGILLGVISSIIISLFTIANQRLTRRHDTWNLTFYEMCGGLIGITAVMPLYLGVRATVSLVPPASDLFYLILLSLFCTVLLYWLINSALRHISAFTANLSFNLEPVYSIMLAIVIFQENRELSVAFYVGLALIIISVVLTTLRHQ